MIAVQVGIAGDRSQPDRDHQSLTGNLDASQVAGRGRLRFVIGRHQPGRREVIGATDVEPDVPVGPDASEKEPQATQRANLLFPPLAPVVDPRQHILLHPLGIGHDLPRPQRQVDRGVGPDRFQILLGRDPDFLAVHQQSLARIQSHAFDVVFLDVVVETVLLRRLDRIELVDLHEVQAAHVRSARRVHTVLLQQFPRRGIIPGLNQPIDPPDEMFRRLPGRQGDHATGVVLDPLDEPHGNQLSERWKIENRNDRDLLFRRVKRIQRRVLQRPRLDP